MEQNNNNTGPSKIKEKDTKAQPFNTNGPIDVAQFVEKNIELLNMEKDAEIDESLLQQSTYSDKTLVRKGRCLAKLMVKEQRTGLAGRALLTLVPTRKQNTDESLNLPAHRFSAGDIVTVIPSKTKANAAATGVTQSRETPQGVVFRVTNKQIIIAFEEFPDELTDTTKLLSVYMMANTVTFKRMTYALNDLTKYKDSQVAARLKSVLLGEEAPYFSNIKIDFTPMNKNLNQSQLDSIKFALEANDLALIHGPPGTGKTTTVVELIIQMVKLGQKVLACAPSNIAVDNIVEKLADSKIRILRLGHPARLLPSVLQHSLDYRVNNDDNSELASDIRKDMDSIFKKLKTTRDKGERFRMRGEIKGLKKELYEREEKVIKELIANSDVILATNVGAADRVIRDMEFDVVVIDEAAQALEASCWIPILKARKLILAGDHCQLPPTITSVKAEKEGLGVTLFDRMVYRYGDTVRRMLTTQYRMHEAIMKWPSMELYENKLIADNSVKSHLLRDIPSIADNSETSIPLLYIDTAGCELFEAKEEEGDSKWNEGEANIVVMHIESLRNSGIKDVDIAVITPYNAQVQNLRDRLRSTCPNIEIGSVDGFQGREKEIISMVRSNSDREIGFLAENRRTNVAVTRARRHLAVVGDSETISVNPFLKRMVEYMNEFGEVRSGFEYLHSGESRIVVPSEEISKVAEGKSEENSVLSSLMSQPQVKKERVRKNKEPATTKTKTETKTQQQQQQPQQTFRTEAKQLTSDEDKAKISVQLENQITKFIKSKEDEFDFPPSLGGFERMIVHEIAEKYDLEHKSKGQGQERYINLRKKGVKQQKEIETPVERLEESFPPGIEEEEEEVVEQAIPSQVEQKKEEPAAIKNLNNKKNKAKSAENKSEEELLEEAIQVNKECRQKGCKQGVSILGRTCPHCGYKFCMNHSMPEVHGCGDMAKAQARSDWLKNSGQPKAGVKMSAESNRKVLENRLKTKLDKVNSKRKPDQKKKN